MAGREGSSDRTKVAPAAYVSIYEARQLLLMYQTRSGVDLERTLHSLGQGRDPTAIRAWLEAEGLLLDAS